MEEVSNLVDITQIDEVDIRQIDEREDGPNNIELLLYKYPSHQDIKLHVYRRRNEASDFELDFDVPIEPEDIHDAFEHPYRVLSSHAEKIGSLALNDFLKESAVGGRAA